MPGQSYAKAQSIPRYTVSAYGTYASSPINVNVRSRSRNWNNTAGYKLLMRNKVKGVISLLPVNSYTDYNERISPDGSGITCVQYGAGPNNTIISYYNSTGGCLLNGPNSGYSTSLTDPELTEAYNRAFAKLRKRMDGSNWSVPIFLAELKKTRQMIAQAAIDIASPFSAKRNAKLQMSARGRKYLKAQGINPNRVSTLKDRSVENIWLEYRYGWRLLVKDIVDALSTIHDIRNRGIVNRVKVVGTVRKVVDSTGTTNVYGMPGTASFSKHEIHTYGCELVLSYTTNPSIQTLAQLGITNPLSLGWELIPFSFVADWFVNVGSYLESLDLFIGKNFVAGSKSTWHQVEASCHLTGFVPQAPRYLMSLNGSPGGFFGRRFNRAALSSFPQASLPTIDINLNSDRLLDAISLLTQIKKRS